MMRLAKNLARLGLRAVPTTLMVRGLRERLIGFSYHAISEGQIPHVSHLFPLYTPQQFEQHLIFFKSRFNLVSLSQIRESLRTDQALPRSSAFVSFDDGLRECLTVARPLLLKHRVPCIFFLATGFLDNQNWFHRHALSLCIDKLRTLERSDLAETVERLAQVLGSSSTHPEDLVDRMISSSPGDSSKTMIIGEALGVDFGSELSARRPYLTSADVELLLDDGFAIGGHSNHHPDLRSLAKEEALEEIVGSCTELRDRFQLPSVPFAFPYSGKGFNTRHLVEIGERYPFIDLFFGSEGLERDPVVINRVSTEFLLSSRNGLQGPEHVLKDAVFHLLWRRRPRSRPQRPVTQGS